MTAFKRYGNVVKRYTLFSTVATTVDENSASGQAVLKVASTTGFTAGDVVEVDSAGAGGGAETLTISSIQTGVSLTFTTNLTYSHTAAQADIVILQGKYQDVEQGGTDGDGKGEVWRFNNKTITIKAASVTDAKGFTVSLYGKVNGEEHLFHTDSIVLAADNGTYAVYANVHYDDVYCKVSNYKDGTLTVKMTGRV